MDEKRYSLFFYPAFISCDSPAKCRAAFRIHRLRLENKTAFNYRFAWRQTAVDGRLGTGQAVRTRVCESRDRSQLSRRERFTILPHSRESFRPCPPSKRQVFLQHAPTFFSSPIPLINLKRKFRQR